MGSQAQQYRVLQVSNISPSATRDQLHALFSFAGRIEECKIFPTETTSQTQVKFAFIKFDKERAVETGQHLTNVVFIDRALVCVPAQSNTIPDEETALQTLSTLPGQRMLPPNLSNQEQDVGDGQKMLFTIDPTMAALGLPQYPALPVDTEPSKVEEIRRTVYVGNLEKGCDGDQLMKFFNMNIGEVMYLRMAAGNENMPCAYAYIEFSNQSSVPLALQNNGIDYNGRCLRIQHSRVAIIKPQKKTAEQALEEVEEAIKSGEGRDKPDTGLGRGYSPYGSSPPRRRRSPSPISRRRTPTPLRRLERSRSPANRRSRSPPSRRRRSSSRDRDRRRRSSSRDRYRRSSSKDRHRKRRDSSKDRRKRSRSPSKRHRKSRSKSAKLDRNSRRRSTSCERRSRSPSSTRDDRKRRPYSPPKRSDKDIDRTSSATNRTQERSNGNEREKERDRGKKERKRSRSRTPKKERRREKERSQKKRRDDNGDSRNKSPSVSPKDKRSARDDGMSENDENSRWRMSSESPKPRRQEKTEPIEMDFEEETLREKLLERVKRKVDGSENGSSAADKKFDFKPEPMDQS